MIRSLVVCHWLSSIVIGLLVCNELLEDEIIAHESHPNTIENSWEPVSSTFHVNGF